MLIKSWRKKFIIASTIFSIVLVTIFINSHVGITGRFTYQITHLLLIAILFLILILFTVFYSEGKTRIELEEIEEKLKKYRERRGVGLKVLSPEEFEKTHGEFLGVYLPHKREVHLPGYIPIPIEGYMSRELEIIKNKFPNEWEEIRKILLTVYKTPDMPLEERLKLYYKLLDIGWDLLNKVEKKGESHNRIRYMFNKILKKIGIDYDKKMKAEYEQYASQIKGFLNKLQSLLFEERKTIKVTKYEGSGRTQRVVTESQYTLPTQIFSHIRVEAHETGHGVFHKLAKDLYTLIPRSIDEGFADAFATYQLLKHFEMGHLSPNLIYELQSVIKRKIYYSKYYSNLLNYAIGNLVFKLDEVANEIDRLHTSNLAPEEFRKRVSYLRRRLGSAIEYVIGIINNPNLSREEKVKILQQLEDNARKRLENL